MTGFANVFNLLFSAATISLYCFLPPYFLTLRELAHGRIYARLVALRLSLAHSAKSSPASKQRWRASSSLYTKTDAITDPARLRLPVPEWKERSPRNAQSKGHSAARSRHQGADLAGCRLMPHLLCKCAVPPLVSTTEGFMLIDRGQQRRAANRDGRCPPDEAVFDTRYACTSLDTDTLMLMFAPHTQTSASTLVAVASRQLALTSLRAEISSQPADAALALLVAPRLETSRVPLAACSLQVSRGIHALRSFPGIHSPHSFILGDRRLPALG
ncbi:hypothetical protein B0H13DRAFT_2672228 [Mycena leptocephala]|nr:hypothetical protein B0H13DRAFT_2672228 [Mycena leptocephala]